MNADRKFLEQVIQNTLCGNGAHVGVKAAFDGLDWKLAGVQPRGVSHSSFQLLNHMIYWDRWVVQWLIGQKPLVPKHAQGSWPGKTAPQTAEEWHEALHHLDQEMREITRAVQEADLIAKRGPKTPLEMLQTIASHNSYHLGQVVLVRQGLGGWPPPSGGLTW